MKKLWILIFAIFLVSFVSAEMEWDNWKSYDEETKTITITNWLNLGETLETAKLTFNTYTCGDLCYAEKNITIYQDSSFIDDVRFYRIYASGDRELGNIKSYQLSYYGDVPQYDYSCKEIGFLSNGTIDYSCNYKQIGNNKQWLKFNEGDVFSTGTYKVRLEGIKRHDRSYDWEIKIQGRWSTDWAIWGNISAGDDAEIILNSPADGSTEFVDANITFNATGNVTGVPLLINMSLYTNITGSWKLNQTIVTTGTSPDATTDAHGRTLTVEGGDQTFEKGVQILIRGSDVTLEIVNKVTTSTATKALLYNSAQSAQGAKGSLIEEVSFSGDVATFSNQTLNASTYYYIVTDNDGSAFNSKFGAHTTPITGTNLDWIGDFWDGGGRDDGLLIIESVRTWENVTTASNSSTQVFFTPINGTTLWNVEGCDSDGDCGFAPANFTVDLEDEPPTIFVSVGNGTQDFGSLNINHTINYTVTDTNLDSCLLEYNLSNRTIPCTSGFTNSTNFTLQINVFNATIYTNDTLNNLRSKFLSWNYSVFETSQTFNASSFETASEGFTINITTNGTAPLNANLIYNGTLFPSATITNTNADDYNISRTINIPIIPGTKSFNFNFTISDVSINSSTQNQIVNATNFTLCGAAPQNITYLNITFKNETLSQEDVTATIDSTFIYSLGTIADINKTLIFTNATENLNYAFCSTPGDRNLNIELDMTFSNSESQQRAFSLDTALSSVVLNQVLFLLPTQLGLFSPFKTTNINGDVIDAVTALITRVLGGSTITVTKDITDSSGFATFFLNPNVAYTATFSKTGFEDNVFSFVPTADLRTVIMGGGVVTGNGTVISRGTTYTITPTNTTLNNNTDITFGFNVSSSQTITLISMNITNSSGSELLFASNTGTGFISGVVNTGNNTRIFGSYIIQTADETISVRRIWVIGSEFVGDYSIFRQFTLFTTYGFSDFIRLFLVIITIVGVLIFMSAGEVIDISEGKIAVVLLLVWAFSIVGWLDTGLATSTTNTGINRLAEFSSQFGIALLSTGATMFFIMRRIFIRRL